MRVRRTVRRQFAVAGAEVAVKPLFETVRVLVVLLNVQGSNLISVFLCGPALMG